MCPAVTERERRREGGGTDNTANIQHIQSYLMQHIHRKSALYIHVSYRVMCTCALSLLVNDLVLDDSLETEVVGHVG